MPNFKRALIGYDAESVDQVIGDREARFNVERQNLSRELAAESHQLELLRVEVAKVKEDVEKKLEIQRNISQQLFDAYILSVRQGAESMRAAEKEQQQLIDKMAERNRELEALKREIREMHKDFYAVADRYKKILNK